MSELVVREMTIADTLAVASLCDELGYPSSIADIKERWRLLIVSSFDKVFVAENSDCVVIGFAHISKELSLTNGPRVLLKSLVVSSSYRGKKVGTKLLAAAEKATMDFGIDKIRVGSQVKRQDAHRFYEREGFSLLKTWHLYQKNLVNVQAGPCRENIHCQQIKSC